MALWENVLAGRRAFRRLPDERMNSADYWSPDPAAPDRFYSTKAAVLRDYEFDRFAFRVAGSTYRSTDLTHWLALDVAAQALADAGFAEGEGLPKARTSVVLGNSLTGEFSRANVMRLRWPYVRRTVAAALAERGWSDEDSASLLGELEQRYKAPFPGIDEDSLAGGLANTIAGRICNYFDLAGGGYTVDGACSSSLLSVATGAKSLVEGDVDVALAGGVDLSIDPFEVIGFAKTGALATDEMKVYDKGSNGFWPGEGAGLLVLMREDDAVERGMRIYATITGWGISSDGKGGITRPEASGHRLALSRAYERAGYGLDTVSYLEGHGTGTALGDATEIEALSSAREAAGPAAAPAALSSVKGNIGHTKAAAGVAGLIKATLAVHHEVIPPATGHYDPHPLLTEEQAEVFVPDTAVSWPRERPMRAGVSAMGFGGINTHIAIEQAPGIERRADVDERSVRLVQGRQDAEVLLLDADDVPAMREQLTGLVGLAQKLAYAELADLAGALAAQLSGKPVRAAVVASGPDDAARKLANLAERIDDGTTSLCRTSDGVFLGTATTAPKIAYLFPGQGSGRGTIGAIRRRFATAEDIFETAALPTGGDQVATEVAQPRIVTGSLAALRVLDQLGIEAATATGHSLGELTALHWGGAMDETAVLRLAAVRGKVMASASRGDGAMAGLSAGPDVVEGLIGDDEVVIAGYNSPSQTVISGPADAVERVSAAARDAGIGATRINVSHAFHSPSVEPAAVAMAEHLATVEFDRLSRPVISTVTGDVVHAAEDLRALLQDQVVLPVRFREAAAKAAERADLVFEVGPGKVLGGLMAEVAPGAPVLSIDTDSSSLAGLLGAVGAAHVFGANVRTEALFADRVVRPLPLDGAMSFLASPCEQAPAIDAGLVVEQPAETSGVAAGNAAVETDPGGAGTTLDLLRTLAAERVELPVDMISSDTHPLDDLHLSSITVGQIVNEVTRALGRPALEAMPNFATVCLGELAEMIDELAETAQPRDTSSASEVPGVAPWVRSFGVDYRPAPRPDVAAPAGAAVNQWTVHAPTGHRLAEPLRAALSSAGLGDGVLLCLPTDCDESHAGLLLTAGREVLAAPTGTRFVVVQHGLGASGLAKTLRLEDPSAKTTIVTLADIGPDDVGAVDTVVERVVADTLATDDFTEVRYDETGARLAPVLRSTATSAAPDGALPIGEGDVLLVTGGGKGITAECALAIARESGATLALLGRSEPADDEELAANLARLEAAGVRFTYQRADVTSWSQVADAVGAIEVSHGPVTAVLHGAGRNDPSALLSLTEQSFAATLRPKIDGLRAVFEAVDTSKLKLLVTFGSIIGRAGLRGEAHYATANDWMTELTLRFKREHPQATALALEWSVWSGAGMGERLGVVEALKRDGITPIPTEQGIDVMLRLLADPDAAPVQVVCGRAAGLPTLALESAELPLARFVDRSLVHYPGIELVTEADLSSGSDPYLDDHLLDGDLLFPAVMGMEAMTQVASALTGQPAPPLLEDVAFHRPVVVPRGGSTTIRIAALAHDDGAVDVALRSSETGFGADHFTATLRFPRPAVSGEQAALRAELPNVPVEPVTELYGSVLFQGKRFQRLLGYRRASARHAVAEIGTRSSASWFAPFLPQEQLLADPGTRDAMMHAIQCCVPDATLLPESIDRLYLAASDDQDAEYVLMDARERAQDGDSYVYDVDVRDPDGVVIERWEGLRLRAVRSREGAGPWVPAMLGPYLQRSVERVIGGGSAVVVEPGPAEDATVEQRREHTALAACRALDRQVRVRYRPDGKPEIDGEATALSASHGAGLTLVVAGEGQPTCDIEPVVARGAEDWSALLGAELLAVAGQLAAETDEAADVVNTRVWSAMECVRKTGLMTQSIAVERVHRDGWVSLAAGRAKVATWVTEVHGRETPIVFAVLHGEE